MKCIRCEKDCRWPERRDGKCPNCKGVFAFEPQKGDPITDWAFAKAIQKVSAHGYLKFYPEHLYYQVTLQKYKNDWLGKVLWGLCGAEFACSLSAFLMSEYTMSIVIFFCGIFVTVLNFIMVNKKSVTKADFNKLWQTWLAVHGEPDGLLLPQSLSRQPQPFDKELLNYSFDRVVICDNPQTVDLLLANRFHFEHNCAILGINDYPLETFKTVKTMLKNNPKLQIFALHDCTIKGCMMAQQLATAPDWFRGHGQVIDVGLRPAQSKQFKRLWSKVESQTPFQPHMFNQAENKWLTKYQLELAVVPPYKLMEVLHNAFNRYQDVNTNGEDVIYVGSDIDGSSGIGGEIDGFG